MTMADFEKKCSFSKGYIKGLKRSPSADKLANIFKAFPDINPVWLINGDGNMYKSSESTSIVTVDDLDVDLSVPDCLFPTDNALEIPTLRLDMQPKFCDIPFVLYGEQKRTFQMGGCGTLHFYCDDYRFNSVYEHPEKILFHNPANIVEPNFSLFTETPIAFGMQAVYKKRFIARQMQEKGIRVFVDLNVNAKFYKLNLLGVPKGYSCFSTRGYSDRVNQLYFEYEIAKYVAQGVPRMFVVYGGGEDIKKACNEIGAIYVNPIISIKNKAKSFAKMKESIAFFGKEIDPETLLPGLKDLPTQDDLMSKQIQISEKCIENL